MKIITNIIFLNSNVPLRNEGGARICGEAVLANFLCHFKEILISIFTIAVLHNQAICGLFNYFWLISMHFQFSYLLLCGVYMYICAVLRCCLIPLMPPSEMIDCSQNSLEYLTSLTIQSNYKE